MPEYESNISYIEPSVSYFDSPLEAGEKAISAIAAVGAIALAALLTSARGSENVLED